jgi:hypothetical protein
MNRKFLKSISGIGLLIVCALILSSCGESRTPYVGTYKSDEPIADKGQIEIVLRDNGEAEWSWGAEGKPTKFKWRVQDNRVWLYTATGAIIIATPSDDKKQLSVDMTGEWHEGCPTDKCIIFTRQK